MGGDGAPAPPRNRTAWIARAVDAWLGASDRDMNTTTERIYAAVVEVFRRWLLQRDLDLASAEPLWLLATTPHARLLAMAKAISSTATPEAGSAHHVHDEADVVEVWDLAEHRARELALVEDYAATRGDAWRSRVLTTPATHVQRMAVIGSFYRFAFTHGSMYGLNQIGKTVW